MSEYYEKCRENTMPYYPYFLNKLKRIEKISKNYNDNKQRRNYKKIYKLSHIVWDDTLKQKIEDNQSYPSDYFINIIMHTILINKNIINYPIIISEKKFDRLSYISLDHNKLQIIEALMNQGSHPRYKLEDGKKYIYSEHSGVLSVKNNIIDNIIVSAETDRLDKNDNNIFLPNNTTILGQYPYIFHTHPNTSKLAGRVDEGIIYEFPSTSDLLNFLKYSNDGKAQSSIVVAPEGIYVIRHIEYKKKNEVDRDLFNRLTSYINDLETMALKKFRKNLKRLSDPNVFHKIVGADNSFINMYNNFIKPSNLYVEYYPRQKKK